ncbi:MAG: VWA domain-containing protein [Nanoarchaeota archaeon]|nr:VWA domain-containing protein [Nanoarchaeota archaeon]
MGLSFENNWWLWLLLAIPVIIYMYNLANKKKKKSAIKFSNLGIIKKASSKTIKRQRILFYILLGSIIFIILGLADPHIPLKQAKEGVNVVLVLDVSGSMQATDYKPTRLESAKLSAKVLLENLEENDHAGIVIFESGATTAAYISPFKEKVISKLEQINPKEGRTAVGDGLALGVDMATSIPNKKKVIILLSDGVNNAGVISPEEAVSFAKEAKIKVFTIGMGSEAPVVLGYDWFGNPQYAELDEQTLRNIASMTGGEYFKTIDDKTLKHVYEQLSEKIEREKEPTSIKDYLIAAALLMLVIQFYLRYGRKVIIQ